MTYAKARWPDAPWCCSEQLKARYFRLMDAKDWDGWKLLFSERRLQNRRIQAPCQVHSPGNLSLG